MKYFLGIVMRDDVLEGRIIPAFVLYRRNRISNNRTGLIMHRFGEKTNAMSIVLFDTLIGSQPFIDYISRYRFPAKPDDCYSENHKYRKIFAVGSIFWFECNDIGHPNGNAIFVKNIPDDSYSKSNDLGCKFIYKELNKDRNDEELYSDLFLSDRNSYVYEVDEKKFNNLPQFSPGTLWRQKKKARLEDLEKQKNKRRIKNEDT